MNSLCEQNVEVLNEGGIQTCIKDCTTKGSSVNPSSTIISFSYFRTVVQNVFKR
jgi:hypothetical protein